MSSQEEIQLTFCSDTLPKAYVQHSTISTNLPRKMWIYFVENVAGETADALAEIWIYQSVEAYDKGEEHIVLQDLSQGLYANGVRNGNLLLFKTRNEAA